MITLPYFVDIRLPEGSLRNSVLALVENAFHGTDMALHLLTPSEDVQSLADLVICETSDAQSRQSTKPALLVSGTEMVLADGITPPRIVSGADELRAMLGLADRGTQDIARQWSAIQTAQLPRIMFRLWYPLLLWLAVRRPVRRHEILPRTRKFEGLAASPEPTRAQIALLMSKSDALADIYSQKYRSAFVGRFVLSAIVAVFVALMLFVVPQGKSIAYGVEFVTSIAIIRSFIASSKGDWKGSWLSFRFIGESLRNALAMGHDSAGFLLHNRDHPDDPVSAQERLVDWCVRQIIVLDTGRSVADRNDAFGTLLKDQIDYHTERLAAFSLIERRLSKIGMVAFLSSMSVAVIALTGTALLPDMMAFIGSPIALALGILPAIGATLFAIRVQANFNAEALHSNCMVTRLTSLSDRLGGAPEAVAANLRGRFTRMQQAEFSEWQQVQLGRALDLP